MSHDTHAPSARRGSATTTTPTALVSYATAERARAFVEAMRGQRLPARAYLSANPQTRKADDWPAKVAGITEALPGVELLDFTTAELTRELMPQQWPALLATLGAVVAIPRRHLGRYVLGTRAGHELRDAVTAGLPTFLYTRASGLVTATDCRLTVDKRTRFAWARIQVELPAAGDPARPLPTLRAARAALGVVDRPTAPAVTR